MYILYDRLVMHVIIIVLNVIMYKKRNFIKFIIIIVLHNWQICTAMLTVTDF